jgi:hypothetical protein
MARRAHEIDPAANLLVSRHDGVFAPHKHPQVILGAVVALPVGMDDLVALRQGARSFRAVAR